MVMAVVLITLTTTSIAENVIHHSIVQTIDGSEVTDGSNWFQHAGIAGTALGDENLLDQSIEQDLSGNMGLFFQDANLTGIISGDENTVTQSSIQSANNNDIFNTPSGYPLQKSTELVVVVGNHSAISQMVSQITDNNTVSNSKLYQTASQALVVIGDGNSADQEISQSFANRTFRNAADVNQTATMRSIIVGNQDETGDDAKGEVGNNLGNNLSEEELPA
jgi:hypothetical protein